MDKVDYKGTPAVVCTTVFSFLDLQDKDKVKHDNLLTASDDILTDGQDFLGE